MSKLRLCREFYFDSAHLLPDYKGKCERLHGHTYKLEVVIEADKGNEGMVMDFGDLKKIVEAEVLEELDHIDLNDVFENPTAENMTDWIFNRLAKKIPLYSVKLWEGRGKWVQRFV